MDINIKQGMTDSHFHIMEMQRKGMDISSVFSMLTDAGAGPLLDAGVHLDDFEQRIAWKGHYDQLYFAAGIHPNIPRSEWPEGYRDILHKQLRHPRVKAVGETGLDFFREYSNPEDQYTLLNMHHELSLITEKPLILHIRNAEEAMKDWIMNRDFPSGGVLHCFPGDKDLALTALEKGFYISYAGNVTFKNADEIRESLKVVPLDRILLETDAPYLAPHPKRGRENHPGLIGYSYDCVAAQKGISTEDLTRRVDINLKKFLRL